MCSVDSGSALNMEIGIMKNPTTKFSFGALRCGIEASVKHRKLKRLVRRKIMYYEEKIINGVLMYRSMPDGKWMQCSIEKMGQRIIELEKRVKELSS